MLTFDIQEQSTQGRCECAICLIPFDLSGVMVGVRGDNERVVYLNGYVCPRCVLGGSEQIAVELRNRAEDSRRAAEQLERWASEPFDVPAEATAVIRSADPLWQTAGKPPGSDKVQ